MCSICWEDTKEKTISLQTNIFSDSIKNYKVICLCNIIIHKTCMNKWIQKNKSCPICHKLLYEYQTNYSFTLNILINSIKYIYSFILNILKYIYSIFTNIILLLFIVHFVLRLLLCMIYVIKLYYEIKDIYYNIVKYL